MMAMKMKPLAKGLLAGTVALSVFGVLVVVNAKTNWFKPGAEVQASIPSGLTPITGSTASNAPTVPVILNKSNVPVQTAATGVIESIPWLATMGLLFANGGPQTTEGSLMAGQGLNFQIQRQNMYGKMQENMLKFAQGVKDGVANPEGTAFVVIMGDGTPGFASSLQPRMAAMGQSLEVIGAIGFSAGEDKFLVDKKFSGSPNAARGILVAAVPMDGDYNIVVTWAAQSGIPINVDPKTYDKNAINFTFVDDFTVADQKFISGATEERAIVENGRLTGAKITVTVGGTATWTPGDVNVFTNRNNVVTIASTREYSKQMPAVIIGNRDWNRAHPEAVKGLLRAALTGSDMVRSSEAALRQAGAISAAVYQEQDPAYWVRYAKGVETKDRQGNTIRLGGSRVINLADNKPLFGLGGQSNLFKRIYTMFGDHNAAYFQATNATYPAYESVVNTTYLDALLAETPQAQASVVETYNPNATGETVADGSFQIGFDTGSATISPSSMAELERVLNQTAITSLSVEIRGHTDDVGNADANQLLSQKRAEAVRAYFMTKAASSFPEGRIVARGYGDTTPAADNATEDGRAQNRRVQIILRKAS
jgi:OmpA-OmpF porin, OOP family